MQLKPADLDLLVTSGAYGALLAAAEAEQQRISTNRLQATPRAPDIRHAGASNGHGVSGQDALERGLELTRRGRAKR